MNEVMVGPQADWNSSPRMPHLGDRTSTVLTVRRDGVDFPHFLRTTIGTASCARMSRDCGPPGAGSAPPVTLYRPAESHISSSLVQRRAHAHEVRCSCMYDTGEESPRRAVRLSRVAIVK